MRVRIQAIRQYHGHELVEFYYADGRGMARWAFKDSAVPIGKTVDVEMDIDTDIRIGQNAKIEAHGNVGISVDAEGNVFLMMSVEAQDDDGLVCARLGSDCLVMVENQEKEPFVAGSLIALHLQPHELSLTPIGE